jgi:hypothetical protein
MGVVLTLEVGCTVARDKEELMAFQNVKMFSQVISLGLEAASHLADNDLLHESTVLDLCFFRFMVK